MVQKNSKEKESAIDSKALTILVVGDAGVGKTSLIYSLVNDEFKPDLPARLPDVTLSENVLPDRVPLHIVDYSEREQNSEDLKQLIEEADVVCVVYLANELVGLKRVKEHWLKVIRQYQNEGKEKYKPIILAANKSDLLDANKSSLEVPPILKDFKEIEACIHVSAQTQKNVVELFYLAQKSVLYPLAPLFDPDSRVLTKKCRSALVDIFKLCDLDGDDLLSDHELNLFHENCFGIPLQKDALDDLKSIIKQSIMDGIKNDSITQTGFLFLHTFSIDKGRHAFTWRVLRKFNYDNQINITNELNNAPEEITSDSANGSSSTLQNGSHVDQCSTAPKSSDLSQRNQLDLSWINENSRMIRAGFGLTVATIISMIALKYLVQGGNKGSI